MLREPSSVMPTREKERKKEEGRKEEEREGSKEGRGEKKRKKERNSNSLTTVANNHNHSGNHLLSLLSLYRVSAIMCLLLMISLKFPNSPTSSGPCHPHWTNKKLSYRKVQWSACCRRPPGAGQGAGRGYRVRIQTQVCPIPVPSSRPLR